MLNQSKQRKICHIQVVHSFGHRQPETNEKPDFISYNDTFKDMEVNKMEKSANKYKQFNQKQSGNDSTHRVFNFDKKLENAMTKYDELLRVLSKN